MTAPTLGRPPAAQCDNVRHARVGGARRRGRATGGATASASATRLLHAHPLLPRGAQSDMGDPPADEDEEAESARARSEGESEVDEDLEDDEVGSDEETDNVDSDDESVLEGPPRRPARAARAAPHALHPSHLACCARTTRTRAPHSRLASAHSRLSRAPLHLAPPPPNPPLLVGGEEVGAVVHRAERARCAPLHPRESERVCRIAVTAAVEQRENGEY